MINKKIIFHLLALSLNIIICNLHAKSENAATINDDICLLECPNTLLSEQVRRSLTELTPDIPFVIFDLALPQEDIDCFKKLKIKSTITYDSYDNYGDLAKLECGLKVFLQSLSNENEILEKASKLIMKIVTQTLIGCEQESAWVSLRASTKTDEFDLPRWHTDGYFYNPFFAEQNKEQYKIVLALKGPGTLLYPQVLFNNLPSTIQKDFHLLSMSEEAFTKDNRMALAKMLDMSNAVSAKLNYATIFIVGADYAAIHSEPLTHEDRFFLSILPGSKEQILELYNVWHPVKE